MSMLGVLGGDILVDLQKASILKRFAAWMIDAILIGVLAVGIGFLLSLALGYDSYNDTVSSGYAKYEQQYDVVFDIGQDEYLAMSEEERLNYDAAYDALIADDDILRAYNMLISLILLIITLSLLISFVLVELVVPLCLKNGQTVGKKVFALAVMRTDGVKLSTLQLFARSVLGKFTVETMIPVYILLMLFWGTMGVLGLVVLAALFIAQAILVVVTQTNSLLHDIIACTVVVDYPSQRIFESTDDLIAYTKRIHAEQAARQDY